MTDDEDYAKNRFNTAIPRGLEVKPLEMSNFYPAKTRQHLLGAVGEGGDKSIPHEIQPDPIINNQPNDASGGASSGTVILVVNVSGVLHNFRFQATDLGPL